VEIVVLQLASSVARARKSSTSQQLVSKLEITPKAKNVNARLLSQSHKYTHTNTSLIGIDT